MPSLLAIWIWLCAYLNCAGWALSALHQLNAGGYAVALGIFAVAGLIWKMSREGREAGEGRKFHCGICFKKFLRRFRKPFPFAFLILATMAFLGGVWHAPSNYDALAYRIPRVLHWLDAGRWHWVHTVFDRLNNRSCGIEWISAPVIALLKTIRPLFLVNFISFLFLPGVVFSIFTRLGVRPRVAWHWMWLAPTGYCFLLQAASIGNDLFGALFALAAVDFALRARTGGAFAAFSTSILAAAMMTAAKTNNLPLLLPCAVALLPSVKIILRRPLATLLVCALAVGGSGLPTIYFNWKMSGDWSGAGVGQSTVAHALIYRTGANVVSLAGQNLVPPVFPMADQWNQTVKNHLPPGAAEKLEALIEIPGCWFPLPQMQTEENAGLGFGLTALLAVSVVASRLYGRIVFEPNLFSWLAAVRLAGGLALLALLTQANVTAIGRLFAAYYLLPFAILLTLGDHEKLVRRRWWRVGAWLVFAMAAGLLVISPARPLFPRDWALEKIRAREPAHPKLVRVEEVYSIYRDRPNAFASALAELPAGEKILGYIAFDKPETTLWQPFGARRVIHVCPGDRAADLKAGGVRYVLADPDAFEPYFKCTFSEWLRQMDAAVVKQIPLRLLAAKPVQNWQLVRLN
jgi:hypothetical protein